MESAATAVVEHTATMSTARAIEKCCRPDMTLVDVIWTGKDSGEALEGRSHRVEPQTTWGFIGSHIACELVLKAQGSH